jgi:hypothetical protein
LTNKEKLTLGNILNFKKSALSRNVTEALGYSINFLKSEIVKVMNPTTDEYFHMMIMNLEEELWDAGFTRKQVNWIIDKAMDSI